jgi:hypothetical protein
MGVRFNLNCETLLRFTILSFATYVLTLIIHYILDISVLPCFSIATLTVLNVNMYWREWFGLEEPKRL